MRTEEAVKARSAWISAAIAGVILLALLIGLGVLALQASNARARANAWQLHTYSVLLEVERLSSRLSEMQRGTRGYALTQDEAYLEPYRAQLETVPQILANVAGLTADNPVQQNRVRHLAAAITELERLMAQGVEKIRTDDRVGFAQALKAGTAEALMRSARADLSAITATETQLLARRNASWADAVKRSDQLTMALSVTAGLAALLGLWLIMTAARTAELARSKAVEAAVLAISRDRLEIAIAERTGELAMANAGLKSQIDRAAAAEGQVRQLQKLEAVGQLTGGIAHDFNNMLAIVLGSLDLAQRRLGDTIEPRVAKLIDNAIEGAKRAAGLTARLLAFSRQQPLAPEAVDANKFVLGMSELLRRTIGDGIEVETVLAGGLWRTYADAAQLESALVNLAVNARDAMPGGGKLTIETANTHLDDTYAADHAEVTAGQYVVICCSDTGTGMPPHVIERAFDPFYTTKGVGKGTGLGLSQVYGFIKQSSGHIKIYSEPDHGTTVKMYLPRWFGDAAPDMPSDGGDLPRGSDNEIVLVVEDETNVRHMSVDALRELGYTVIQASDGEAALSLLQVQPVVHLLFTDIVMPGINGRKLADRAVEMLPGLKVLFTTGYTQNAVVHNGMLDPGVAFLAKPFTLQQLAKKVRQVMDGGGVNRSI